MSASEFPTYEAQLTGNLLPHYDHLQSTCSTVPQPSHLRPVAPNTAINVSSMFHQYFCNEGATHGRMFKTDHCLQDQTAEKRSDNAPTHQYRAVGITQSPSIDPSAKSKAPLPPTGQEAEPQAQCGRNDPDIARNIQSQVLETPSFRVIPVEAQRADDKVEVDFADPFYIEWQVWSLEGYPE
jgi:hypothetical protein